LAVPSRIVALIINHYPGVEIQIPFGSMFGIPSTTVSSVLHSYDNVSRLKPNRATQQYNSFIMTLANDTDVLLSLLRQYFNRPFKPLNTQSRRWSDNPVQ